MACIELENICYTYKKTGQSVLKGVTAEFQNGKLCSIIGPSGSGKTTLLSILAGLDSPSEGEVRVNGKSLREMNLDLYRRKEIAMVFQSFQLLPLLKTLENVAYPMRLNGADKTAARARAEELLKMLGISEDKWGRFPANLSGGEQQRVAIARALSTGAGIILADEPTGNLDQKNTEHIFDILKQLAQESGYCVVVVTHDMQAAGLSDHVWRMCNGMLQQEK